MDKTWEPVWGTGAKIVDQHKEAIRKLREPDAPHRRLDFIVRVFHDGIALRYALPKQATMSDFKLTSERMYFRFAAAG